MSGWLAARLRGLRTGEELQALAQRLDPALLVLRAHAGPAPPAHVVGVYRHRNAAQVSTLLKGLPTGWTAGLWALDQVALELDRVTVGVGPGARLQLLNRALVRSAPAPERWLVVADDDVRFRRGSPIDLVAGAAATRSDLCQPAHTWNSHASFDYVRNQRLTVVRRGGFVEQGPVVVLSPRARTALTPFPEHLGMGWGIELLWHERQREGLVLAVVDAVTVHHLVPLGGDYDHAQQRGQSEAMLLAAGFEDWTPLQRDRERWRVLGRAPAWVPTLRRGWRRAGTGSAPDVRRGGG